MFISTQLYARGICCHYSHKCTKNSTCRLGGCPLSTVTTWIPLQAKETMEYRIDSYSKHEGPYIKEQDMYSN